MSRFVRAAVFGLATIAPGAVVAQSSSILPAEFPPADFAGNQYVDSSGCAFIRAGISGNVTWVPRMTQQRNQLCGFEPTFGGQAVAAAPLPNNVEIIAPDPEVAAAEIAAGAPTDPAAEAVPANAPDLASIFAGPAPTPTTASLQTRPNLGAQAAPPPRIDAPAAAPVPATAEAEPEPPTMTLAEACEGRSGVQPRFINANTGEPIDCGPAPTATLASAAPEPAAPAAPAAEDDGVLRLTLAEICTRAARDGTRFVDARTGDPVACPTAPTMMAGGPAVPSGPAAPQAPDAGEILSTIARLAELRDSGARTDEEFSAKKAELLARL